MTIVGEKKPGETLAAKPWATMANDVCIHPTPIETVVKWSCLCFDGSDRYPSPLDVATAIVSDVALFLLFFVLGTVGAGVLFVGVDPFSLY